MEISADSSAPPGDLASWALSVLTPGSAEPVPPLTTVAGDASNRRYFRAELAGASRILVDAPPATEKNEAFLAIRDLLATAGVSRRSRPPEVMLPSSITRTKTRRLSM